MIRNKPNDRGVKDAPPHGRRRRGGTSIRRLCHIVVVALLALPTSQARAQSRFEKLEKAANDSNYKVRMIACISMGRLKNRRFVPVLVRRLNDGEATVRAMCAGALGKIGDPRAAGPLRSRLRIEPKPYVKSAIRRALGRLAPAAGCPSPSGAKFFIVIRNTAGKGNGVLKAHMARSLYNEFKNVPRVAVCAPGSKPSPALMRKHCMKAFAIESAIQSLTASGGQISCSVKVSLATYPGNSMKAFYTGGASMGGSASSPSQLNSLYKPVLAGAAQGARQRIAASYINRQQPKRCP